MPMYSERQLDRAMSRAGVQETPGQFRKTFANLRNTNPEMYAQKRAEQRDAYKAYQAQQSPAQAASSLASKLAQRKMRQGAIRPAYGMSGVPSFGM